MQALRASIMAILILLTLQGLEGDFVNLFAVFPTGVVQATTAGFFQAVDAPGIAVQYHVLEAFLILATSIITLILSLRQKTGRLFSILGTFFVVTAGIGGILFVLSGYTDNSFSAQMGSSFIGAYAFYFLALYSTKK